MREAASAKEESLSSAKDQTSPGGSMEEILASIRKIITSENNETVSTEENGPQPAALAAQDRKADVRIRLQERAAAEAADAKSANPTATIPANAGGGSLAALADRLKADPQKEMRSPSENAPPTNTAMRRPIAEAPSATPGGLADLAARVKTDIGTHSAAGVKQGRVDPAISTSPGSGSAVSLGDIAAMASGGADRQPGTLDTAAAVAPAAPAEPVQSKVAATPSAMREKPSISVKAPSEPDNQSQDSPSAFKTALLAPSTQAAVSGSLDRLKKTVADVDAAQVDAALRPLLKEWLDDNLPTLVEKLVQQEIDGILRDR